MKNFKKILSLLLVLSLAFCMVFALNACGDPDDGKDGGKDDGKDDGGNNDGKVTYTVYVKDDSGNPISGVTVAILLDGQLNRGEAETDESGKVSFKLDEDNYSCEIVDAPLEYELIDDVVELKNGSATIELEKLPTYTIYVKHQNGTAAEGVMVQMCDSTGCRSPRATDAEGKAEFIYAESDFKAQISGESEYYYFSNYEVTIYID